MIMHSIKYLTFLSLLSVTHIALAAPRYVHTLPDTIECSGHTADTCVLKSRFFSPTTENAELWGIVKPGTYTFYAAKASFPFASIPQDMIPANVGYNLIYSYKNASGETIEARTSYAQTLTTTPATAEKNGWVNTGYGYECLTASAQNCSFVAPY
jgi:hypothetical protein